MNAQRKGIRRIGVWCGVMAVSLAMAVTASATVIDDFTSSTRDSHWVQSTVLQPTASGTYTFDTTTNAGELTITESGVTGGAKQDVLLRKDVGLGVGQTLMTDVTSYPPSGYLAGLSIAMDTGITARKDMINIMVESEGKVQYEWFSHNGGWDGGLSSAAIAGVSKLYIARTATNVYDVGYYVGSVAHSSKTWTITDGGIGNLNPGVAIGYFCYFGANASARFDNFQITEVPEPSSMALLVSGMIGLLAYAWRRQK